MFAPTRCTDPTELGTYCSSSRCPTCPGNLIQTSGTKEDGDWTCDGCGHLLTAREAAEKDAELLKVTTCFTDITAA